ncbi:MAG: HypC/HybG/HupF family hydrogenase formation chaperone [Candidatus Omnitrophica bacterium]|nr:HypC/HybG/HupF family hydrogenase formation chaperone [Candidatus Omnitrophota bacterium]
MCLAIPGKIKKINENQAIADFGGVYKKISLGILNGVKVGDYVLVHAGFAISRVKRREAMDSIKALKELKEAVRDEQN